jgi:hypothetical protein
MLPDGIITCTRHRACTMLGGTERLLYRQRRGKRSWMRLKIKPRPISRKRRPV